MKPNVYCRIYKRDILHPIMSWLDPFHDLTSCFFKIHLTVAFYLSLGLQIFSFLQLFKKKVRNSHLCYIFRQLIFLDFIIQITSPEAHILWDTAALRNLFSLRFFLSLPSNILVNTLFSIVTEQRNDVSTDNRPRRLIMNTGRLKRLWWFNKEAVMMKIRAKRRKAVHLFYLNLALFISTGNHKISPTEQELRRLKYVRVWKGWMRKNKD